MTLSGNSTVAEWVEDPVGGFLVHDLLRHIGRDEDFLTPVREVRLQDLVALTQGLFPQSVVDDLVRAAAEHTAVD